MLYDRTCPMPTDPSLVRFFKSPHPQSRDWKAKYSRQAWCLQPYESGGCLPTPRYPEYRFSVSPNFQTHGSSGTIRGVICMLYTLVRQVINQLPSFTESEEELELDEQAGVPEGDVEKELKKDGGSPPSPLTEDRNDDRFLDADGLEKAERVPTSQK